MKWLLIIPVVWGGSATQEMAKPEYWPSSDEIVLTTEQISRYNASLLAEGTLDLYDILSAGPEVSGAEVVKAISSYTIPASYGYLGKDKATAEKKNAILASRNLQAVPAKVKVEYGIVTSPADLRSFPTKTACTQDGIISGSLCFDDFQQTHLWLGEGVLIWHRSADGRWFFVRAKNYAGWVEAENIGLCSREQMLSWLQSPNFGVALEHKFVNVAGRPMRVMMGTRLPKDASGSLLAPVRKADGSLETAPVKIDMEFSNGFLPYTTRNVLKQAFRLLGVPYSWGGADGYNDCSATVLCVYYCFGIELPRNSSSMRKMVRGNHGKGHKGILPGSIAVFPGHAMMYVGEKDGEVFILHDLNAMYSKANVRDQRSTTIISSTSDIFRKNGVSFADSMTNYIEVR